MPAQALGEIDDPDVLPVQIEYADMCGVEALNDGTRRVPDVQQGSELLATVDPDRPRPVSAHRQGVDDEVQPDA